MCEDSQYKTRYSLLERALDRGDSAAWEELLDHYRHFFRYLIKPFGIHVDDQEDLEQKVFILVSRDLHKYDRTRGKFRNWLSIIVKQQCLQHLRNVATKKAQMNAPGGNEFELRTLIPAHNFAAFLRPRLQPESD